MLIFTQLQDLITFEDDEDLAYKISLIWRLLDEDESGGLSFEGAKQSESWYEKLERIATKFHSTTHVLRLSFEEFEHNVEQRDFSMGKQREQILTFTQLQRVRAQCWVE